MQACARGRSRIARLAAAIAVGVSMLSVIDVGAGRAANSTPPYSAPGYWLVASDGGVYQYGTAAIGSLRGEHLNRPIIGGAATTDGLGYWLAGSDGGVFGFGDAHYYGSTGGIRLNQPIVGMAADPATGGYWLVASDGGIFAFHAGFFGSTGGIRLNRPVVGMAPTPDGKGYWLVASDGGVFAFGDAHFHGSTGSVRLNRPVVGMAATSTGTGYWLVASDGGIFAFNAPFRGSTGGITLDRPIVGMSGSSDGKGYWLVASDGGVFAFGDAPFIGSTGGNSGPAPIVAMMATPHGYPFLPGATGYDISLYQCSNIPSQHVGVAVVQVSGGAIDNNPNPCYAKEAAWAGPGISAYIFMDGLPSGTPPQESKTGPAGTCNGSVTCESYNYGWWWARRWVSYSRSLGINPSLWWLDVETGGSWDSSTTANARVIAGAVAGLRSEGAVPGIYSTAYQWGVITGNSVSFPGIALWVPGGGNVREGSYSATSFCSGPVNPYEPFAGGSVVLVQYGYYGNGYNGPSSPYDQDYACI